MLYFVCSKHLHGHAAGPASSHVSSLLDMMNEHEWLTIAHLVETRSNTTINPASSWPLDLRALNMLMQNNMPHGASKTGEWEIY